MSFPRYPKYKDSSVEWLGEVPAHWKVMPIKRLADLTTGITPPTDDPENYSDEGPNGWIRPEDLDELGRPTNASKFLSKKGWSLVRPVSGGASLICCIGSIGKTGYVSSSVATNQQITAAEFLRNGRYFYFAIVAARSPMEVASTGNVLRILNSERLGVIRLPCPPSEEADLIATFLDRETATIDALVAEQQRLIELLDEKRQAAISRAVTKGLSPDVVMRTSDIEWLPEVPAHWRTVQVKHLARPSEKTFTDGDWIEAPYITDEGVRLIQTGNVGVGVYKEQGFRFVSASTFKELGCTEVAPRDVLICRLDGPVGRACLAPDLGGRMITSVDNTILKVADEVAPEFVVALFSSVPWIAWLDALCRVGGGFRLRVSRSQLGELRVPLPPLSEQLSIARYLDSQAAKWAALAAEAQRAIDLLQERRTALISAAVTGQIDVRAIAERAAA